MRPSLFLMKIPSLVILAAGLLAGCRTASQPPTPPVSLPQTVIITNDSGETMATQTGPLWVLLSGVDEHGLIVEHEVALLAAPDATAEVKVMIHTGTAVAVQEIRHSGPQGLRRFYQVQTLGGENGWISDYYVRRVAYLFDEDAPEVLLYAAPGEKQVAGLPNVSPVTIKDPTRPDWWIVQTPDGGITGWVAAGFVKESPEQEFLLKQQHEHK